MKPYSKDNTSGYHLNAVCAIYFNAERLRLPHSHILEELRKHYAAPAFQALTQNTQAYVQGGSHALLKSLHTRLGWYHVTPNGTFLAPLPTTERYDTLIESFHGYSPTERF